MLGVERFGTEQLQLFVMERLVSSEGEPCHKKFHDPMKRSNPPTLANLYKVKKGDTKSSTMKVDIHFAEMGDLLCSWTGS